MPIPLAVIHASSFLSSPLFVTHITGQRGFELAFDPKDPNVFAVQSACSGDSNVPLELSRQSRSRASGLIRFASSRLTPNSSSVGAPAVCLNARFPSNSAVTTPSGDTTRRTTRSGAAAITVMSILVAPTFSVPFISRLFKLVDAVAALLFPPKRHDVLHARQIRSVREHARRR